MHTDWQIMVNNVFICWYGSLYYIVRLVMCYNTNGEQAGLNDIQIWMLVVFLFNLLRYSLATHKTCTHLYTLNHWIYQHKTYITFSLRLNYWAIDFLEVSNQFFRDGYGSLNQRILLIKPPFQSTHCSFVPEF